jgi:hypothetical protein
MLKSTERKYILNIYLYKCTYILYKYMLIFNIYLNVYQYMFNLGESFCRIKSHL